MRNLLKSPAIRFELAQYLFIQNQINREQFIEILDGNIELAINILNNWGNIKLNAESEWLEMLVNDNEPSLRKYK